MQIDLSELKQTIDRLFNHIMDTRGVKFFEFEKENYWNIPSRDVYEFEEPKELDIGNLSDDWEFLSKLLQSENQPVAYQLTQVAPLLRYIGERIGADLAKDGG